MANVDKIILEKGYGCSVEMVAGATMPTFTSMNEKGQPDIAGELWANAVANPLKKAIAEGRLHSVNDGPITGLGEGWWLPPHTVKKHPELKTALDVLNNPEAMGIRGKQADSLMRFYNLIKKYNELLPKLNAGELVRTLIEESGIKEYYRNSTNTEDNERE